MLSPSLRTPGLNHGDERMDNYKWRSGPSTRKAVNDFMRNGWKPGRLFASNGGGDDQNRYLKGALFYEGKSVLRVLKTSISPALFIAVAI
jgi:hypothetical protein